MRAQATGACSLEHCRLASRFPRNEFVRRLLAKAASLGVRFAKSPVAEQWLYHPEHRTIYLWEPDLTEQPLSYLVVILAHELGHAVDFDHNPRHQRIASSLHWRQVPDEIEIAAFVEGFLILKELWIPVSLDQYVEMIQPPLGQRVRERIESEHLCCIMSGAPSNRFAS